MRTIFLTLSLLLLFENGSSSPRESSFVVLSEKIRTARMAYWNLPDVFDVDVTSKVSNSFATTLMATKVRNRGAVPKETIFTIVLPDMAFISEFVMEVGTKRYRAFVKETEAAKNIYDTAVASGNTAAHIKARDSNRFTVSLNVEPNLKVRFLLTYEELLQRRNGQYELVLNIHPGSVVQHLNVEVTIKENRPIKFVRTPSIRSGNEIIKNNRGLDPSADIKWLNSTMVTVTFDPTSEEQRKFARHLKKEESDGFSGQFVVQYDVERNSSGGEIFLQDGYFVHFFAPNNLNPLPKHVLFVLDTSGSMSGKKIRQLKTAMASILRQIKMGDKVSIIQFSTTPKVWDINSKSVKIINNINYYQPFSSLSGKTLPVPREFNRYLLMKAKQIIYQMRAAGITNIIAALETALYMVKTDQDRQGSGKKYHPIIIFLTDGKAYGGINSGDKIVDIVTRLNSESYNTPIISLSFGEEADKDFLKKLSSSNNGFWKHIYEASDASLQLEYFYKEISSPLLSCIDFEYTSDVTEVTIKEFPIYFQGAELVVAGKYEDLYFPPTVTAVGAGGPTTLKPVILGKPVTQLERLWAYLTVKQILDKRSSADNREELTRKAVTLAQKYSFVTDVTSLVVVKPTITSIVDIDNASEDVLSAFFGSRSSFGSATHDEGPETESENDTEAPSLQDVLPWLASVLQANETINVGQNVYQLGSNYSSDTELACTKTPYNNTESGICVLLKDCPDVYSNLTSLQVYQNYFCAVDTKYAGICCPKEELED